MEPDKGYWVEAGLALVVLLGASCLLLRTLDKPELAKTSNSLHVLEKIVQTELNRSEAQSKVTTQTQAAEAWAREKIKQLNKTHEVIETFDPITGKLSTRKTVATTQAKSESTETKNKATSVLTVEATQVNTLSTVDTTKSTDTKTETTAEYAVDKRSGVSFGLMVSGEGVGPVASINLLSFKPVHLDFVTGMAPAPKAGIGVALEPFPRLSVGVAAAATFTGDPLGYYHPAFPLVGVAPVVTAQYRF